MKNKKIVGFGILIIILYWIIESLIHLLMFSSDRNLIQEIFFSNSHEFWMRLTVITLLIIICIYLQNSYTNMRISEEKYSELVENANCIIISMDKKGRIIFINEYGESFFGYSNEELVGRHVIGTIVPKTETSGRNLEKMVEDVFQHPEKYERNENENITKNGKKVWVSWTNKAIKKNNNGGFDGILSFGNDITERKVAEHILKEREDELKNLEYIINHSPAVVFLWRNAEGWPVDFVSDNVQQFGYEPEEFYSGKVSYAEIIHSDDLERVGKEVSEHSEEGRNEFVQEYRIVTKSGKTCWVDDRTWVRRNSTGEITHYQGIILDITNRKLVEEKLKESEEKFRTIAEQSLMGICIAQDNKIQYINKKYADIWGYSVKEMMQWEVKDAAKVIHPEDRAFALGQFVKKQKGEQDIVAHYQYRGIKNSGEMIWVENFSKPIIYRGRSADLLTLVDITEKKKAIQNLKESEENYRELFEKSPISLWEEDFSNIKKFTERMKAQGVEDLRAYLDENPDEIINIISSVEILDVNKKTLEMFNFNTKEELMKGLGNLYTDDAISTYKEGVIACSEGKTRFESEITTQTSDGKPLHVLGIGEIVSGYEKDWSKVLYSVINITDLKEAEQLLKESEKNLKEYAIKLEILNRIILAGNQTDNLQKLLNNALKYTLELMQFDAGGIYLINETKKNAKLTCSIGLSDEFIANENWKNIDDAPFNKIFKKGRTIFSENYYKIDFQSAEKYGILSLASIPLIANKNVIGILIITKKTSHTFSIQEKDLLLSIGRELGSIISKMKVEEALKKSEKFFSDVFTSIQDGICIIDNDHKILQVNPKIYDWYPSISPILGKKCYELFCNSSKPCVDCYCFKSVEINEPYVKITTKKNRNIQQDGIIEIYIFPFKDQQTGEITGIVEYIRDVSEKHEFIKKFMESEKKSKNILDNIKEGYFEVDLQGNLTFLNDAMVKILGYSNNELISMNFNRFMDEETNKKVRQFFYNVYKTGIPQTSFQFEILNKSHKKAFIETSVYLRYDSKGKKIGFCGLLRDISEQKQAEKIIKEEINKLKEIDKLKNEFVYRASHELKTPLNSISGASKLLLELHKTKLDNRALDLIEIIIKGGDRLEYLIKNLLDVSKIESRKLEFNLQKENISDIIKETVKDLFYLIEQRNMNLSIDIDEDIYLILDRVRIEQVFVNLIVNALNYTPPKGIISISAKKFSNFIDIYIQDSGLGFTEEEKGKIFKKFGKIERYGKGSDIITEGTGLGLYISKEIIELHKGKIWVESEGRNRGSTFVIRIPINNMEIT